jgi:uncharacterized protein (DUF58 family)
LGIISGVVLLSLVIVDLLMLYRGASGKITGERNLPERFSNGDENQVQVSLRNGYPFGISLEVIDELPVQLQIRDFLRQGWLKSRREWHFSYTLRPVERGEYHFGNLNVFARTQLGLVTRRFRLASPAMVKVYPSFLQMRRFEIMAISDRLSEIGIKKVRKFGHQMEFDQIREYIK